MKILTILGARPQFIKASCLSRAFKNYPEIQEVLVHTGQHYDPQMSEIFFQELQIPKPTYHLKCGGKSQVQMMAMMLENLESIMLEEKPDAILVYGDTNSTLAGAITGSKLQVPIIHIEAGLRSFNPKMSEELNRILTDRMSRLLFCPTDKAMQNLENEGFLTFPCKIYQSGDVMKDNALFYSKYIKKPSISIHTDFILATIHRSQNTDDPKKLKTIFEALDEIASKTQVVLPIHPRTAQKLKIQNLNPTHITLTSPLSYLETLWMLKHTQAVFTDSGGLQKEAYFFEKPCFILRDESEWEELIASKCGVLVQIDKEKIIQSFGNMPYLFTKKFPTHLYGDGDAGNFIAKKILEAL